MRGTYDGIYDEEKASFDLAPLPEWPRRFAGYGDPALRTPMGSPNTPRNGEVVCARACVKILETGILDFSLNYRKIAKRNPRRRRRRIVKKEVDFAKEPDSFFVGWCFVVGWSITPIENVHAKCV